MIARDLCRLTSADVPTAASFGERAQCEEWRDRLTGSALDNDRLAIDPMPHCGCCGAALVPAEAASITSWTNGATRCDRHQGRNPCAIEGCRRTRAAPRSAEGEAHHADDQWLCADHWRRFVPPRSARRRAYHGFFRRAKRHGWTVDLRQRFWRFWDQLVRQARRRAAAGHLDQAAIGRMFGWEA